MPRLSLAAPVALTRPATVRPCLTVDLDAIAENTRRFVADAGAVIAVVKANGYGHGAADVARTALANGARMLGVTSLDEALALRRGGIDAAILSWLNPVGADWAAAATERIEVAVPSLEHLHAVETTAPGARIHLHLDTGLARDGAAPDEWEALCRASRRAEELGRVRVVGIMGHLPHVDPENNARGRERFERGAWVARNAGLRPHVLHLAATAAALTEPHSRYGASRIGAGLVGIDPSRTVRLRHAMALTAPLVDVRAVGVGTGVGYGHDWVAASSTRLGLLPLGYADGLPRAAAGRAEVLVAGQRRPIVGRISMDQVVVDLRDAPAERGDTVTVFGPGDGGEPTVSEWADWAGTIDHEIVVGLGDRLERHTIAAAEPGAAKLEPTAPQTEETP